MAADVFISYSREPQDQAAARALFDAVAAAGLSPWMDTQLEPGDDFRDRIFVTIAQAPVLLFLVTPASARDELSQFARKEVLYALQCRRRVIPCRLAPATLPHRLAGELIDLHWLDLSRLDASDWAPALYDALDAAGLVLTRPPGAPRRSGVVLQPGVRPPYRELSRAPRVEVQAYLDRYSAALRANPDYGWGRLNLGLLLLFCGQRDEAVEHLKHATRAMAANARAHYFVALALASGKPLKYQPADVVSSIESKVNAARSLDPSDGLPDLLDAVVLAEHYRPNFISRPRGPGVGDLIATGRAKGVDADELERLLDTVVIGDQHLTAALAGSG